jgi:hypothetical protein
MHSCHVDLTRRIDQLVEYFNKRTLDLPDGVFDRRTQFVINGAPFETLLGRAPEDPLIQMLARGPAGYRFAIKALQHAVPDARIERPSAHAGPPAPDPLSRASVVAFELRLTGKLRGSGEAVDATVPIALTVAGAGHVEVAEATLEPVALDKIRHARLIA